MLKGPEKEDKKVGKGLKEVRGEGRGQSPVPTDTGQEIWQESYSSVYPDSGVTRYNYAMVSKFSKMLTVNH